MELDLDNTNGTRKCKGCLFKPRFHAFFNIDVARSSMGNLNLRALRLTPSFMKLYKDKKFTTEALAKAKLTFSNIFEELPITIRNTALLDALLFELETTDDSVEISTSHLTTYKSASNNSSKNKSALTPSFDMLDLSLDPYIAKNLENLMDTIDEHHQEQGNYAYWQRSVERENKKKAAYLLNRVRLFFFCFCLPFDISVAKQSCSISQDVYEAV